MPSIAARRTGVNRPQRRAFDRGSAGWRQSSAVRFAERASPCNMRPARHLPATQQPRRSDLPRPALAPLPVTSCAAQPRATLCRAATPLPASPCPAPRRSSHLGPAPPRPHSHPCSSPAPSRPDDEGSACRLVPPSRPPLRFFARQMKRG